MKTVLSVADAACLDAVRKYTAELGKAGLPVRMEELAIDDGWTRETAVSIEWGARETAGQDWELEDDELDDDEEAEGWASGRGLDDGQGRLAEHYLRTVQCLARDVETSKTWLGRTRRRRKKRPR
ncbi:MAG: hypothetical protein HQ582_01525 [Planctomycetes bacterium]|nr:hypothetical protein [Planctomycetota bacterium]